jgi:hypothetical protein
MACITLSAVMLSTMGRSKRSGASEEKSSLDGNTPSEMQKVGLGW